MRKTAAWRILSQVHHIFHWHDLIHWTFDQGYPGCEFQIRDALNDVLGERKGNFFFDKVRNHQVA